MIFGICFDKVRLLGFGIFWYDYREVYLKLMACSVSSVVSIQNNVFLFWML
jgi:hypothetical protein